MNRTFVTLGGALAFLGVALGAFGTHSLKSRVAPADLAIWQTGVQYHTLHAVSLILIAILAVHLPSKWIVRAGWLHVAGIVIFGGSLYALVLSGQRWLGAITPLGGLCFLAGWLSVVIAAREASPTTV